jgi:TetR/AcrR family fatty acid metabolism transcriptional regulator
MRPSIVSPAGGREFKTLHGPREQLEYIAQVHLESHAVNRSMAILMQTEVRQSAKFIAEFSHHHLVKYIQVVREVVRRGQQEGIFRRDVSDGVVAHCMFGAIDELLSSAVFTGASMMRRRRLRRCWMSC